MTHATHAARGQGRHNVAMAIPLCEPDTTGNESVYVADAIGRNQIAQGDYLPRFERMVADYLGVRHAVAVSSGTAALHLSLLTVPTRPGKPYAEVVVSDLTFIAPVNAVKYFGAHVTFVDAEPEYWQMSLKGLVDTAKRMVDRRWFTGENTIYGDAPKAILPVHLLGHPCDMGPILQVARKYKCPVIEDATESLGSSWDGQMVGTIGDIACFSFNGNKLITTGGGGMVVTDNSDLARQVRYLANQAKDDPTEYVHKSIGYNYRMSNLQAAVGCAQMERIELFLAAKRRIAETYTAAFTDVPGIEPMKEAPWARSSWWLYTVRVKEAEYGMSSRHLRLALRERGIESRTLWQPMHLSAAHQDAVRFGDYPVAELLHRECLSLPCSVGLAESQQERVIEAVKGLNR